MPMSTYKPIHTEVSIASANDVNQSPLTRVYNANASIQVLHFSTSTGTEYANLSIASGNEVIIKKSPTDRLQGNTMVAVDVAYEY
jgi:hypothetical protein